MPPKKDRGKNGKKQEENIFADWATLLGQVHEHGINLSEFSIYLEDRAEESDEGRPGVEHRMSSKFIKNLHLLSSMNDKLPILVHMKTPGGHVDEGMAIVDAIRACPNPVIIVSHVPASSMSGIILQAATVRVMVPSAHFMLHKIWGGVVGNVPATKAYLRIMESDQEAILELFAKRLQKKGKFKGWAIAKIVKALKREMEKTEEVYLTSHETVDWGFADGVLGSAGFENWNALRKLAEGGSK